MTGDAPRSRRLWIVGVLTALLLAGVVSAFASTAPDGLERVAETVGLSEQAQEHPAAGSPLSDYRVRGMDGGPLAGGLAGAAGVLLVLTLGTGLAWVLRRRRAAGADALAAPSATGPELVGPDSTQRVAGADPAAPAHGS